MNWHNGKNFAAVALLFIPFNVYAQMQNEQNRGSNGANLGSGVAYRNIAGIPIPINRGDIEHWSQMMLLSDVQKDQLGILYESYLKQEAKVHKEQIQPLWDLSVDISRRGSPATDVILAEEFTILLKTHRPRAVKILVKTEDRLFNDFVVNLEENQWVLLDQVRSQRERQRYNRRKSRYPGGDVDLPLLLWKLYGVDLDLIGEQRQALQLLINEYDESTTPLFKNRLDAILDISSEGSLAGAHLRNIGMNEDGTFSQAHIIELRNRRKHFNRKLVKVEKRIHDQNVHYLNSMIEILPEAKANGLERTFIQLVYNSIYPDPTDTSSLFESVFVIDELTNEQVYDLQAIEIMIESQQIKLCNQMVKRFLEWRELHGIEWGYSAEAINAYEMDMFELHDNRKENAQLAISLINATILPEQKTDRLSATTATLVSWMQEFEFNPDKRLSRRRENK